MPVVVNYEINGLEGVNRRILNVKNGVAKATAGAINDLLKQARTDLVRGVTSQVKVKAASVRSRIKIRNALASNLSGSIKLQEKARIGLVSFGARATRKGVTYQIGKQTGRQTITDAFIAKARGGRRSDGTPGEQLSVNRVFRRRGKSRLPLFDLKGPSLNAVVNKNRIDAAVSKTINAKLPERVAARIKLLIERGK